MAFKHVLFFLLAQWAYIEMRAPNVRDEPVHTQLVPLALSLRESAPASTRSLVPSSLAASILIRGLDSCRVCRRHWQRRCGESHWLRHAGRGVGVLCAEFNI